jgi:peroxiredoxin
MRNVSLVAGMLLVSSFFSINAEETKLLFPGTTAPSFSLPTLTGDRVALSAYCGQTLSKPFVNKIRRTVVLSFWATYCKPCQKELPQLAAFGEKHKADNVLVLCISVDKDGEAAVAPFLKEKGYAIQALLDPYMKTSERYGVKSLPSLFIIDTLGVIRYCSQGFNEKSNFGEKLEKLFAGIKSGKTVAKAPEIAGSEQVAIVGDSSALHKGNPAPANPSTPAPAKFTPHQKWSAIAKVECGEPAEKVASEIGVSVEELKKWREELKAAAIKIWTPEQK